MALTEKKEIDLIEINNKNIQIRECLIIERDNIIIAKSFHRYVLEPGADLSDQSQKIKDIAEILWK